MNFLHYSSSLTHTHTWEELIGEEEELGIWDAAESDGEGEKGSVEAFFQVKKIGRAHV